MGDDGAVSKRQFTPIKELLPQVLSSVARESGQARALAAVWEDAVGAVIARAARPYALEGETLVLTVTEAFWAKELNGRAKELCTRLNEKLGDKPVRALCFRMGSAP